MKAFLIARVSTDDQVDALPAQVYRLEDYARRMNFDYELEQFQESAYSGSRDKFRAIIDKIMASEERIAVVFDKIDRYSRESSSNEVRILDNLRKKGLIELHFPSDNLVAHKDSPAINNMQLGMGVMFGQYYSDTISDNVCRRFEQMHRDGIYTHKAPFGYKNVVKKNGSKWIDSDPFESQVVKSVFNWYASGNYSLLIVKQKAFEEYGQKFSKSQVDRILKNPFYRGEMRIKGKLFHHKYETIIIEELFEKAESVRNSYAIKPTRYAGLPYAYRGLISCADCGSRITFEKKKGKYVYGHCTQFKGKHGANYVKEENMTEQLAKAFHGFAMPDDEFIKISAILRESYDQDKIKQTEAVTAIDAEIAKYDARCERLYDDMSDRLITRELYKRKYEQYRSSQKKLVAKLNNIELVHDDQYANATHLLSIANKGALLFANGSPEQKRTLLNKVLSNLDLKQKELRWKYKKPYDCMAFCAINSSWLPIVDVLRNSDYVGEAGVLSLDIIFSTTD